MVRRTRILWTETAMRSSILKTPPQTDPRGTNSQRLVPAGQPESLEIPATFDGVVVERLVYSRDLNAGCVEYYAAQAALCDESDSREVSARVNPFSGPSWGNYRGRVRGVFVVDACHDGSCDAVDFNEAWVFQTFAYGKITHIRLSVHESRNGTAPSWHDDGWLAVFDPQLVGPGTDLSGDGTLVGDPTTPSNRTSGGPLPTS